MIQSEEISDGFARLPIHLNVANIQELIPPQHGDSVADTLRNNLRAAAEQEERTGEPMHYIKRNRQAWIIRQHIEKDSLHKPRKIDKNFFQKG